MLSARRMFHDIHADDDAFRLFCSIAAQDEDQGGWENEQISVLVQDPELAPKVARHAADERKHGRIFLGLLRRRGLETERVPVELDYCMLLETQGIGLTHERLRSGEPLTDRDAAVYLCHSRVTEQRASDEMAILRRVFAGHRELGRAVAVISRDEDRHLAYCHEELLRLARSGHARVIEAELRRTVRAEIRVHRDVGVGVARRMGALLGWPRWQRLLAVAGLWGLYGYERLYGWRRMVRLRTPPPELRNALGRPARAAADAGTRRGPVRS